ncbi:MAG: hypothetical protein J6Y94_00365 [Bacteriovoracaceae bacterium]|nr:hypothetical protein [Bacteriovoracaceae bacterium]
MKTLTKAQKEAFLNEFKGAIFEYRLALALAEAWGSTTALLASIPAVYQQRLAQYEQAIWQLDAPLGHALRDWPGQVAEQVLAQLPVAHGQVRWVGRQEKQSWQEADLLIEDSSHQLFPLSLKLSKDQAFVNTKSAGIKSVLPQYFSACPAVAAAQKQLLEIVERSFLTMGMELYQQQNLGIFMGRFDERWTLPRLPGQMPEELRPYIWRYYSLPMAFLADLFRQWQDLACFKQALRPIFGFGRPDLWQVNCFYQKDPWQLKRILLLPPHWAAEQIAALRWRPYQAGDIFFSGDFPDGTIQIRAKPMNVFTVAALKVNCALRHR